ncbi:MFS transporter [Actinoallomurus rhizosphaericola]|uniref:MFS transporter n=1 Tax=Actinoallomurus rhizosphaericola TaxID=2952536 RepID=UPI0020902233|nr:MFS transporter [Actinoallomurus rhizosphaericola]MCO5993758.1 MFS transporter [Actinoallomurus rhizosphaericola]
MNDTSAGTAAKAGRREWIALCVLLLPLLLVSMDVSVLYFAVPFISRTLQPTSTEQLWIFDIYGFVLAGLLITMGALGDRIGRRRLLLIGALGFGLASVAAAYAQSAGMLIAARAVLGVGGATLMPSTLALIRNMFHDEKQRGTAVAIWSAATTSGIALGPVLSGLLLNHFWWGSVFLINTPAMVLLLVTAPFLVPEFRNPGAGRFDLVSSVLSLGAVLPVIYGVKEIAANGVDLPRGLSIVAGPVIGAVFIRRQGRRPDPMIDLRMFRNRGFSGSIVTNLIAMFAMVGFAIFSTQYLQSVLAMSPLTAALWSLVPSLGVGVAAPTATQLARRVNRAYVIGAGFLVAALGFVALTQVRAGSSVAVILVGAGVYAIGLAVVMTLVTDMVLGAAPPERAGTASALVECGSEFGGALGMAILGSVGTAIYRRDVTDALPAGLPHGAVHAVRETLGGALAVAGRMPGGAGEAIRRAARDAFVDGMHAAAVTGAVIMMGAALLTVVVLRRTEIAQPADRPAPASGPASPEPSLRG